MLLGSPRYFCPLLALVQYHTIKDLNKFLSDENMKKSFAKDIKIVTKNESSVTNDIPCSVSSSCDEILLVSEEFRLL
jgi:hypothetical protein